jgi:Bacteriophage head to tail connecting protein
MLTSNKPYDETHEYADVLSTMDRERSARSVLSGRWKDLWSLYRTDPLKLRTDEGWQSKLNDGRVFEIVETVASYIRDALFFSDNWVQLEANEPELGEVVPLVSTYFRTCLNKSNLKREFRVFIRQLLLLGFSGMAIEYVDDKLVFTTISANDVYIESNRRLDDNSYAFRDVWLNYSSFVEQVESGTLELPDDYTLDEFWDKYKGTYTDRVYKVQPSDVGDVWNENVRLTEYWCPVERKLLKFVDVHLLAEEEATVCPWQLLVLYELPDNAYGLSILDSSIGLILENNCIMNRRLDNMALSVDNMWLFIDDGVTNPEDIKSEPGKVITAARPDVLTPLYPPTNNFQVTYQESAIIDQRIDRNTGTGALISSGQYRSGDRVTATEVNSVKDAGGNKLTDVYEYVENSFVLPLLNVALELVRKHVKAAVVKIASERPGVYDYFRMLPKDFSYSYSVFLSASQSIINRDRNIRRLQEFMALVAGVPQFAEFVDYSNLYDDLLRKFGFDDPERYRKQQEPEQAPPPVSPMDALSQGASELMGGTGANAVSAMAASGQLPQLLTNISQGSPGGLTDELPPEVAQQQQLALNQPL